MCVLILLLPLITITNLSSCYQFLFQRQSTPGHPPTPKVWLPPFHYPCLVFLILQLRPPQNKKNWTMTTIDIYLFLLFFVRLFVRLFFHRSLFPAPPPSLSIIHTIFWGEGGCAGKNDLWKNKRTNKRTKKGGISICQSSSSSSFIPLRGSKLKNEEN